MDRECGGGRRSRHFGIAAGFVLSGAKRFLVLLGENQAGFFSLVLDDNSVILSSP